MTSIYINYPNPHFSARYGVSVEERLRHMKAGRRVVRIDLESFGREIEKFQKRGVTFASVAEQNDLWLEIEFGDEEFERRVGEYVQRLLGERYRPLAAAPWR